jgi:DNA-binding transcriptional LysR family regulator
MDQVEVRELRYFVAVAEELNFGRAARRLEMAQPPLSKAIQQLELKLGVKLLERTTRRVELTPAGAVLLEDARAAIESVGGAARRAQRAGQPRTPLILAVKSSGDGDLLQGTLARYRSLAPGLSDVEVRVAGWGEPETMLRDGRADAALLHSPFDQRGIDLEPLRSEPRVAALATTHRLARRRRLRSSDLAGEPFPNWTAADPLTAAYWEGRDPESRRKACSENHQPDRHPSGPPITDLAQLLATVALQQAVALLPASIAQRNPRAGVTYRPVSDVSPSVTAIAWPESSRSVAAATLVRAAVEFCAQQDQPPAIPA